MAFPPQVVRVEDNRSRRERRALATRAIEPAQLGLAGAAQLGCLHRQSGQDAEPEVEYLGPGPRATSAIGTGVYSG